jgi:Family of unknown function (DUF6515)
MEVTTMSYISNQNRYLVIGIILAVLSGIMFFGFTQVASAQGRGYHPHEFMDSRHGHNHAYPSRGYYVDVLPRGHYDVVYGGSHYYFYGWVGYRPYGPRFVVVMPPFGLVVPFLPPYYTTIWVGGIPYYYANDVYYTQNPGGYMVVEPPKGQVVEAPVPQERLFIYPRQGQSEKQQADDRYECHRWAVNQTHYDPTQPPGSAPGAQASQKGAEYNRAMGACLDARGYTVK